MRSILRTLMVIAVLLSSAKNFAQIKNARIETVKIFGNCGMCKSTIEQAGNRKKVANVNWDKETKMATLIYDSKKTNGDEILKRIALAGYDSDKFLAPDEAYSKLKVCCQYDRPSKPMEQSKGTKTDHSDHKHRDH